MRILVVSNLYPPHYIGGYELGCRDAVEALRDKGHTVEVLTSTYKVGEPVTQDGAYRVLKTELELALKGSLSSQEELRHMERHNQTVFRRLCRELQPEVVFLWNMAWISISLAHIAQTLAIPCCCYVFDDWTTHWEDDRWYQKHQYGPCRRRDRAGRVAARLMLRCAGLYLPPDFLSLKNFIFSTEYLKQDALKAGRPVSDARVIYWGISPGDYPYAAEKQQPYRLLFVGRLIKSKGAHTAIEALKILRDQFHLTSATLTIVGGGTQAEEEAYYHQLPASYQLDSSVHFTGMLSREEIKSIYQSHDILIFPSVWEEPFGITILEAMSSGLAVVGTGTGGSGEIMKDGDNALLFPKEDAQACADQLRRLMTDNALYEQIRKQGRLSVEQNFDFARTVDQLEAVLQAAQISKDAVKNPIT
jgi:glycogen(starch) synthase